MSTTVRLAGFLVLTLACLLTVDTAVRAGPTPAAARLVSLPPAQLAKCLRHELLRPVCPRRVPRVEGGYRALATRDGKLVPALYVFDLERFATPWLQPPAGAHITAAAGAVWRLTPYADPTERTKSVPLSYPVEVNRSRPVSYGVRTWNGRRGVLYFAPSYDFRGGQLGDHMVFYWGTSRNRMHALSLHAWSSLSDTVATLRAMVNTLP